MKSARSSIVGLFLIICGLVVATPNQSFAAHRSNDLGRLIIKRSPVLGVNVSVVIYIDGRVAGTSVRARTFDEYIAPGRHFIVASPNQLRGDWHGILDVRPGHTYMYVMTYNQSRLALNPVRPDRNLSYR